MQTTSSEPDPTDDALSDLVREAQEEIDGKGWGEREGGRDQGELIEGPYAVTFILLAPGYAPRDFDVRASPNSIRVGALGLQYSRQLRYRVDPASAQTSYKNGVLCVRVAKAF